MVLQCAGDDLRRARGAAVHQHNDGLTGAQGAGAGKRSCQADVGVAITVAHRDNLLARREETFAHGDGLQQAATGIAPQVKHETLGALFPQQRNRLAHFHTGRIAEALERDVAHAVVEHHRVGNGGHVNLRAGERHVDWLSHAGPAEDHVHRGARLADEAARHLVELEPSRRGSVHLHDAVARLDTAVARGRTGEGGRNHDGTELILDAHAHAGIIIPQRVAAEVGNLLGRVEIGIRIVELAHQPAGSTNP